MSDIKWTAREAMACAYCWAEFFTPEALGESPEAYWLSITEAARNDYRRVANNLWLLAVARGEAVAVTSPHMFTPDERAAIGAEVGVKAPSRIWKIIMAVRNGAARRSAPPCAAAVEPVAPLIAAAATRVERERCERIVADGCLMPPDGGSPTKGETAMCDAIFAAIRKGDGA